MPACGKTTRFKKSDEHLHRAVAVRYAFIKEQSEWFPVCVLCRLMGVSRSGYYAWTQRSPSRRHQENAVVTEQIHTVSQESDATYGSPRVFRELRKQHVACSEKRIARLMRLAGLRATLLKRFVVTTDSKHSLPIAENVLDREFSAATPNAKWSADITYVWTSEGWLYLAVILDLFSRRIVGWTMDKTIDRSLVLSALRQAQQQRKPSAGLLCHSDRGSQSASRDYQKALTDAGIVCSMSRKGNCWDNAPTESFFATIKKELIHRRNFTTRQEAKTTIFAWIEGWYNRKRQHSSLGYVSPEEFERQHNRQRQRAA